MRHELKIAPAYFDAVQAGEKTFEVRKNDRGFAKGDTVLLREWESCEYTGRTYSARIGYVTSYGQQLGYVVFSLLPV